MLPEYNCDEEQVILRIRAGDTSSREDFIIEYKPFIAKTAMNLCRRPLHWSDSDELSIALIAFNSAIDSYNTEKKVPFLPYARVVIQNRLKDFFRKESRHQTSYSLEASAGEDDKPFSPAEIQSAWEDFRHRTIEDDRREEFEEYEELLSEFDISFSALVDVSPKHRDSRLTLIQTARTVAADQGFMDHLLRKKQLPITELMLRTGVNRKTLERGRKFIISTALVFCYPMRFPYLRSYINPETE